MHRLPPTSFFGARSFDYTVGDKLHLEDLRKKLQFSGYHLTDTVIERGEYNIRREVSFTRFVYSPSPPPDRTESSRRAATAVHVVAHS